MTEISLNEILLAREARAAHQRLLLNQYGKTLLNFTMNIAGPVKYSSLIEMGFRAGIQRLKGVLLREKITVLSEEKKASATGCEAFFVLDADAGRVKRLAISLEEEDELGRLFDMDVTDGHGRKLTREELGIQDRSCLLCGNDARICGRARTHTVAQLQEKTRVILTEGVKEQISTTVATMACRALLYEVNTTPKPGLVDRANNGSHDDMDIFTFSSGIAALWPYFHDCARVGFEMRDGSAGNCLKQLRTMGLRAEEHMLCATNGINTHKGAIFSLGILCAALGRVPLEWRDSGQLLDICADLVSDAMKEELTQLTPETADTAGQKIYLQYGITGARGQAANGFPAVRNAGLPMLIRALKNGLSDNDAGCLALLAIMARNPDTNLIHRGGTEGMYYAMKEAEMALKSGEPLSRLRELDEALVSRRLSPGGSADLLSVCWLLHFAAEVD